MLCPTRTTWRDGGGNPEPAPPRCGWQTSLTRGEVMEALNQIRNCLVRFRKVCPARWEQLVPTSTPRVRMCGACDREVLFCETDIEALEHAKAGRCIVKPMPDLSGLPNRLYVLGEPKVPEPPPTLEESVVRWEHAYEVAKTIALRDLEYASRMCPQCGYPCSDWLRICGVCGFRIGRHGQVP